MKEKEPQPIRSDIANKGFSGMRKFVARLNFSCTLIGNPSRSLTGHTATVRRYTSVGSGRGCLAFIADK